MLPLLLRRYPFLIPLGLASAAVGMALLSQYGFGTHPCDLCLLQRYPYAVIVALGLAGLAIKHSRFRQGLYYLILLAFLTTGGIAAYHVGVEQGWVKGPSGCSIEASGSSSLDALKAEILGAPLVSCSDVGASFLGLSMAVWNALYALACMILWQRHRRYVITSS